MIELTWFTDSALADRSKIPDPCIFKDEQGLKMRGASRSKPMNNGGYYWRLANIDLDFMISLLIQIFPC